MRKYLVFFAALLLAFQSFAVGASQEWVKDYVQKSTVSTNLIDALNQILASKDDDEIKTDAEGRLYYTVLEKVNGSYTNTVHYLTPSSSEERLGTFYGAIVTESVNGFFKTGDTLAFAADPDGKLYLVNGLKQMEYYEYFSEFGRPTDPRRFQLGDANEIVTNSPTITCRTWSDDATKVTGQFTIEPCHLLEETWRNCVKSFPLYTYGAVTNTVNENHVTWAAKAPNVQKSLRLVCNAPRMRMMRSGGAPSEQPTVVNILFTPYPKGDMVDTMDYAIANNYKVDYYGEMMTPSHEICWAEPAAIYPANVWNSLEAWTVLPQTVTVYYKSETDGLWYPTEKKIRTVAALQSLLSAYPGVKFPPRDWPGFKLVAKEDCNRSGNHIYGERCECIVCGVQRPHKWDFWNDGECARCFNEKDAWHIDIRGQKVKTYPNGGGGDYCAVTPKTSGGDYADMDLHGGWHHEHVEGDESYNCSCECGYYSTARGSERLLHLFNYQEGEIIQKDAWTYTDKNGNIDGIHHFAQFACQRCVDHVKEVKERHTLAVDGERREDGSAERVDNEHHNAVGYCEVCGYGKGEGESATILEAHDLDDNCYCRLCDSFNHNYHARWCGSYMLETCANCGHTREGEENARHQYGKPFYEDHEQYLTHHRCECGLGEPEEHRWVNGACEVCGVKKGGGVKCASKKAKAATEHTDNQEMRGGFLDHAFNEDIGHPESPANRPDKCADCIADGHYNGFFEDYPEAVECWDKPAEYVVRGGTPSQPIEFNGYELNIPRALSMLNMNFKVVTGSEKMEGASVYAELRFDPETETRVEVKNFAFMGNRGYVTVRGRGYRHKAVYRGIVKRHEKFGLVIFWN